MADTLYAFHRGGKVNRFTLDGEFIDAFRLDLAAGSPYTFACNGSGQFLALSRGLPPLDIGLHRMYGRLELLDATGASVADLGEFPVSERHGHPGGSGPHPYGKHTVLGLGASFAYVGTAGAMSLDQIDFASAQVTTVPLGIGGPGVELGQAEVDRFRAWTLAHASPSSAAWWTEQFKTLDFPDTIPTYTRLLVDERGLLWLRDFKREWDDVERWQVYSPEGAAVATVEFPERFRVHEIGRDHVAGVWTDETGTEYARLYALDRETNGG